MVGGKKECVNRLVLKCSLELDYAYFVECDQVVHISPSLEQLSTKFIHDISKLHNVVAPITAIRAAST